MDTVSWGVPSYPQTFQQKLIFCNVLDIMDCLVTQITWSLKKKWRVTGKCWVSNPKAAMYK